MANAIDKFFRRFHRAVHAESRDMRLSIKEANELAEEINRLLNRLQHSDSGAVEIAIDGGRINT